MSARRLLFLLLVLLHSQSLMALQSDKSSPILIEADQVDMSDKSGISTYTGNVKLTQGSIRISADNIIVFTTNNKLQRLIATGSPATFKQKPDEKSNDVEARAFHVEYSTNTGVLTLQQDALLQQGSNLFSGHKIEYDTLNDIMSARSEKNKKQRIQAIIQPESLPLSPQ